MTKSKTVEEFAKQCSPSSSSISTDEAYGGYIEWCASMDIPDNMRWDRRHFTQYFKHQLQKHHGNIKHDGFGRYNIEMPVHHSGVALDSQARFVSQRTGAFRSGRRSGPETTQSNAPRVQSAASWSDDDVEGIEKTGSSWGKYPIDGLLIRNETRTVYDVVRRIKKGAFVLNPDFQRDFIWKVKEQSRLIESVMMRIPLPVFYLAEDEEGRMIVVDGLQRLSTFLRFLRDDLRLILPDREELHRKTFSDLGAKLQNRVEDCNLTCYIMDSRVPDRARLDIFERVNGGVPLTRQQMRNCLYMGKGTRFLKEEARSDVFLMATGKSLRSDTMRDREFLNRFCAFHLLGVKRYRGDMDQFLAECLRAMNGLTDDGLASLQSDLLRTLQNNYNVFGKHAFRKWRADTTRRSVINASLWDVMSTGLSRYHDQHVREHSASLKTAFRNLLEDERYNKAITYATNDEKRVRRRFEMTRAMLKEVLGDYSA